MQERQKVTKKDSDDSESDFGADDDDSDDDFEDTGKAALKPWQQRTGEAKASRLDEVDFSDGERGTEDAEDTTDINAVEGDLEDYQKVTLPRRRLGRWCNEPFFKDAVKNCFVKLFVGVNEQGKKCYRLCKIVGFETSKTGPYQLPPTKKEKPVCT